MHFPTRAITSLLVLLVICCLFSPRCFSICPVVPIGEDDWTEDVAAAFETAKKDNKDLLLLFTGSDWCPPCQKLEADVLSQAEFKVEITKHFVLVKLDFPRSTPQDETIAQQNKHWSEKFGVDAFPTIFLVDQTAKPYAIAGFEEGGFQNYLGMLEESRQLRINRDEKLKQAEKQTGLERAKLLDEALGEIREEIVSLYYPEIVAEIVELDKEDSLGLRTKWNSAEEAETRKVIMTDVMLISRLEKPQRAIEFIDEVLKEMKFPAQEKLEVLQIKLNLVRQLDDLAASDALLDEMIAMEGPTAETRERLLVKKIYLMIGSKRFDAAWALLEKSLKENGNSLYLLKAKGEILDSRNESIAAIEAYDVAIEAASNDPDILIELVSAKADAQFALKLESEALQTLDNFADDNKQPVDLRAEALLHKSLIMRETNRPRQARLAENRAIEISQSAQQRREIQKIVEKLRAKYGE